MYYIYVLRSESNATRYVGSTDDVVRRLREHNTGKCRYTSGRMPWQLIYQEVFDTRSKAMKQEVFLKSGQGRRWLDENLSQ